MKPDRCLPCPADSTVALILLLATWAFCKPNVGGSRDGDARRGAQDLLGAVVAFACVQGAWSFPLYFDDSWKPAYPLLPEVAPSAIVQVDANGACDMSEFVVGFDTFLRVVTVRRWLPVLFGGEPIATDHRVQLPATRLRSSLS